MIGRGSHALRAVHDRSRRACAMDGLAGRSSDDSHAGSRVGFDTRPGAGALAASALALAVFPLVRPFFPLDVFSTSILESAAAPVASPPWFLSHLMAMLAFVALPVGILALGDRVAAGEVEAARRAAWWSVGGRRARAARARRGELRAPGRAPGCQRACHDTVTLGCRCGSSRHRERSFGPCRRGCRTT